LEQVTASPHAQQHLTPIRRSGLLMRTNRRDSSRVRCIGALDRRNR
jgi:hypothetical protein